MAVDPMAYTKGYGRRSISIQERMDAINWLDSFKPENSIEERDKVILSYFLKENISAQAIFRKNDKRIIGFGNRSKGKQLRATSIARIIADYFPQFKNRRAADTDERRVRLRRIREKTKSPHIRQCAFCGNKSLLEEHHMIPLFMGGTNANENLIYLCRDCHKGVTIYQRELGKGLQRRGQNVLLCDHQKEA